MQQLNKYAGHLAALGLFALAMAYLEAAVVAYLREIYGITDLLQDLPRAPDRLTVIEIGREAATLLMLASMAWAAGRSRRGRLGAFLFTFGLWDIFYYGWLTILIGWPNSLLDWDLLFLIPLPWWGPVLAPTLIALLMALSGIVLLRSEARGKIPRSTPRDWLVLSISVMLALGVLMADALRVLPAGFEALASLKPTKFPWLLFSPALAGMLYFLIRISRSSTGR